MGELLTAFAGILGVCVGALLVSFLERRNWQRQETMKAYASLFVAGDDAFLFCCKVSNTIISPSSRQLAEERWQEHIANYDPKFRHMLEQCWMLERDPDLRARIEGLKEQYKLCKDDLRLRLEYLGTTFQNAPPIHEVLGRLPRDPNDLFAVLEKLRRDVARKYYHGEQFGGASAPATSTREEQPNKPS